MKKTKIIIILIPLLIIISIFLYLSYKNNIKHPLKSSKTSVTLKIQNNDSIYSAVDKNKQIFKHSLFTKLYIKKNLPKKSIKPGEYNLPNDLSLQDLLTSLTSGKYNIDGIYVTIPEGYSIEQIAEALEKAGIITSKDSFLAACQKYPLPNYISHSNKKKYDLEGFLFPDTYKFKKGEDCTVIIQTMLKRFQSMINNIDNGSETSTSQFNLEKKIILASIIEKEVKVPNEREDASSVFYNRLNKGMKLQSCATVLYALGKHKDSLNYNDIKINSPYNTYLVKGLPVGPICNPGKEAIKAAFYPSKTNYLYFVLKDNNSHLFTNNYKDFLNAKSKYNTEIKE